MKMLEHFKSGALRSVKAWKGILMIWLFTFAIVSLVALPLKAGITAFLGKSMITGLLRNGINIDVLVDMGKNLAVIFSSFSSGLLFLIFLVIILNAFLAGGIFTILKNDEKSRGTARFFYGGAMNFRSFFIITLINSLIIFVLFILIFVIPLSVINDSESEGSVLKTGKILLLVLAVIVPVFMLVADYARAWNVTVGKSGGFRSLGRGFRLTFRKFFFSYLFMLILFMVQVAFGWLVYKIVSGFHPSTGGGVLMLFILSQLLFIIKITLKAWRYGSITSLVEARVKSSAPESITTNFEI